MTHAAGNPHPHLVYVRRKPDAELAAPTPSAPCPPHTPTPTPAVASFNLPKPEPSAHDDDHGPNHPDLDSMEARVLSPQASPALRLPWEDRISQLNNSFNKLDQSDQKGYIASMPPLHQFVYCIHLILILPRMKITPQFYLFFSFSSASIAVLC